MKIVINRDWGVFALPKEYCETHKCSRYDFCDKQTRQSEDLIRIVADENYKGTLKVCEIPDENTDWKIDDYDGMESIVYVLNGKLHYTW